MNQRQDEGAVVIKLDRMRLWKTVKSGGLWVNFGSYLIIGSENDSSPDTSAFVKREKLFDPAI